MSELVWIHKFNANELGLGDRGSFCLVPKDARRIFFPKIDFTKNPDISEEVMLSFLDGSEIVSHNVTYSKPPTKTEHRLSLSKFKEHLGDEHSTKEIRPGDIGCFYRKNTTIYLTIANKRSVYEQLLKDFPSRGNNNLVTETVVDTTTSGTSPRSESPTTSVFIELPKPFILLAGISGTGKTRFVRKQALAHNVGTKNFCLVPVRPDWHEPSDLLGYTSRIGARPEYVSTKVLQFVIDAWRAITPNADGEGIGNLDFSCPPYWLCLDEMNLAPVEQYFADYLSALESRVFINGDYTCDPLLDKTILNMDGIREDLGMKDDHALWTYFLENGITLPPNLIVAGTVNMDETTHGFSRKVIDRALTVDFGEFFPNDYSKIFDDQDKPKTFTYGPYSLKAKKQITCLADPKGIKTIEFLEAINGVLKNTPFELAYRALNELLMHLCSFSPKDPSSLQAVWDDFLMTKVLPRIDGDEDKLSVIVDGNRATLLGELENVASIQLSEIWDEDKTRVDLFRTQHDGSEIDDILCRSRKKIQWMKDRLERNTFTSFWP